MKPYAIGLGLTAAALLLSAALVLLPEAMKADGPASSSAEAMAPWQARVLPDGRLQVASLVLGDGAAAGATPPSATLADVLRRWPQQSTVAVVMPSGGTPALEVLVDPAQLGPVAGKLVVSVQAGPDQLERWMRQAAKIGFMGGSTRQFTLSAAAIDEAAAGQVTALAFVPQARLSAEAIVARFGAPARVIVADDGGSHHLYPALGLDVTVTAARGKDVLQFVAPARFEQALAAPLRPASGATPASAP